MPSLDTKVFLIRHGITDWHEQGRLLGRRDRPLSDTGTDQAEQVAAALDGVSIAEVVSSPLQRALQTATVIGKRFDIDVARDHRLTNVEFGAWEGSKHQELAQTEEYRRFVSDPLSHPIPKGEHLNDVKKRAVAAVEQVLRDSPSGDAIAVITHSMVIRVLLTHYMAAPPATCHRLRVGPGSISVLTFSVDHRPRVLAVNWGESLKNLLDAGASRAPAE